MGIFGRDAARKRALASAPPGPMRDFLLAPPPDSKALCRDTPIVALDLETTGLDPGIDSILSVGLVQVDRMQVDLSTAWHQLVRTEREIPEASAVIHQITDDRSASGLPLNEVLPELLARITGRIVLVHYAKIEREFMDRACRSTYATPFITRFIDTLVLAQRSFERRGQSIRQGDLRLFNLRKQFNLPRYRAHNAMSDAIATAELFLAMAEAIAPDAGGGRLGHVLTG